MNKWAPHDAPIEQSMTLESFSGDPVGASVDRAAPKMSELASVQDLSERQGWK